MPAKDKDADLTAADLLGDEAEESLLDAIEAEDALDDMEGIDPNHPVLSVEDQRIARDEARKDVEAERRKAAMKTFIDKEKARLKTEEGLTTGDGAKDEIVEILIDLPEFAWPGLFINGQPFFHGHPYKVPRHQADTLREMQSRAHIHQNEIDGKNMVERFHRMQTASMRPENVLRGKAA